MVPSPATKCVIVGRSSSSSGPIEDLTPYDFATIYNVKPLWTESKPITGSGVTVAIAGESDVNTNDIKAYRLIFGLPAVSALNTIHNGTGMMPDAPWMRSWRAISRASV